MAGQPLFDDTFEQPAVFGYMGFNKEKVLTKKEKNYKKFIFSHKMAQDVHILNKYFFKNVKFLIYIVINMVHVFLILIIKVQCYQSNVKFW